MRFDGCDSSSDSERYVVYCIKFDECEGNDSSERRIGEAVLCDRIVGFVVFTITKMTRERAYLDAGAARATIFNQ